MDIQPYLDLLKSTGPVGAIFILVIWSGLTKKWVFGWQFTEMQTDRDRWMSIAMSNQNLTQKVAEVAKPQ